MIFGQAHGSHKDFNDVEKELHWHEDFRRDIKVDPLLPILCGQSWNSWEAWQIYREIEAEYPSEYTPMSEFPFLGTRLAALQRSVRGRSFMALWYDRRDGSWWWTFWVCVQHLLTLFYDNGPRLS
jgi:hypothetical protein